MPTRATICKGCWQHMRLPVPLRGAASLPFRAFGIRPSRMNPNTCTICEMMFTKVMKARQVEIDATILFADLRLHRPVGVPVDWRDFRSCSTPSPTNARRRSGRATALSTRPWATRSWRLQLPIGRDDHATQAVQAARSIQRRWIARREMLAEAVGADGGRSGSVSESPPER